MGTLNDRIDNTLLFIPEYLNSYPLNHRHRYSDKPVTCYAPQKYRAYRQIKKKSGFPAGFHLLGGGELKDFGGGGVA